MNWHNLTSEIALLDRMIAAVHGDTTRLAPGLGACTQLSPVDLQCQLSMCTSSGSY